MKRIILSISALLLGGLMLAQTPAKRPDNWFNLDPTTDNINGVSTERTYKELLKDRKPVPVVVAVLDSGVDYYHEDLKDVMWTNPGEIPGNGIDDDKNGYVDDIHGWSFLGGKDGKNVDAENLEMTRLYRKYKPKYEGKTKADFKTKQEKEELAIYEAVKKDMEATKAKYEPGYNQLKFMREGMAKMEEAIKAQQSTTVITKETLEKYNPEEKEAKQIKALVFSSIKSGKVTYEEFKENVEEGWEQMSTMIEVGLNPDANPRLIVGDDYNNLYE
ncbi:MAG: peptidase S8, partial [Bacteroidia bacterium]|nr:peptidase S8 [Bacteroidia bacterium]